MKKAIFNKKDFFSILMNLHVEKRCHSVFKSFLIRKNLEKRIFHFPVVAILLVLMNLAFIANGKGLKRNNYFFKALSGPISGKVVNKAGMPLQSVSVTVKGTPRGTTTGKDGTFSLDIKSGNEVLSFSLVGYETKEIKVGETKFFTITLDVAEIKALSSVVVIGYGSSRKEDLTGSISQVGSKQLEAVPAYDMQQVLKGRASGVQVTQNSGSPGVRIAVRVRGNNSMIGDNSPLFVVDGFPVTGGIDYLNPDDI